MELRIAEIESKFSVPQLPARFRSVTRPAPLCPPFVTSAVGSAGTTGIVVTQETTDA